MNLESKKLLEKLQVIRTELNGMNTEPVSFKEVLELVKDFNLSWKHMSFQERKSLLWSLLSKVVVGEKDIKIELFFLPSIFSNFDTTRARIHACNKHKFRREAGCF